MMKTIIGRREYTVKKTGTKYFYWSPKSLRWLPIPRAQVVFPPKVDLSKITEALLIQASETDDITSALILLQDAAGIDSGDAASVFFSGTDVDTVWPPMAHADRLAWLRKYVAHEAIYVD